MSTSTLTPQQARIAALNRLKAREKFTSNSAGEASKSGSGLSTTSTSNNAQKGGNEAQEGKGNNYVNKGNTGPSTSRNAVQGQKLDEAPLRRDPGLVS